MDFYNGKDLLKKCQEINAPISDIMKLRETTTGSLSIEEVDEKLHGIMKNIFKAAKDAAENYGTPGNYVVGANIAGFLKVADTMVSQGII